MYAEAFAACVGIAALAMSVIFALICRLAGLGWKELGLPLQAFLVILFVAGIILTLMFFDSLQK